jgi:cytochrome P450
VEKHYRTVKAQGKLDEEQNFFLKQYSTATDEFDTPFTDERIATTVVLMIWGAYIEAAANMGHALWTLIRNPEKLETLKKEVRVVFHKIRHTRFAPTRPAKGRVTGCRCSRVITHEHYERPEYKAACSLCINRPTQ